MTEEKKEIELREIIVANISEFEPELNLNDSPTLDEAMDAHEDLFRTHYKFTDRDFDMMVLDLIDYIGGQDKNNVV